MRQDATPITQHIRYRLTPLPFRTLLLTVVRPFFFRFLVASGCLDIFWEMELNSWDVMAGKLILEEAGEKGTNFSGKNNFLKNREILASNGTSLHNQFIQFFKASSTSLQYQQ